MKAVVLAAGRGIRLQPLTDSVPKALVPLKGKPLLERVLTGLVDVGFKDVVVVVGYLGEKIVERFGGEFKGAKLAYVRQEPQEGTGHALTFLRGVVGDAFLLVNVDVIVEADLYDEVATKEEFDVVIAARQSREPWRYGCLVMEGDKVVDVVEKPAKGEEPSDWVGVGVYRLPAAAVEVAAGLKKSWRGEYELTDVFKRFVEEGSVGVVRYNGECVDIGSLEDLERAEKPGGGNDKPINGESE